MSRQRAAMRPAVRKAAIFEFVEKSGEVSVDEIAEKFATSHETVRRDLNTLADAGKVRKVHGGVRRISANQEGPFDERLSRNTLAKQRIAEKIAKTVSPNQSLFIDTGSTTLLCAEALLRTRNLTVITNSTRIAEVFSSSPNGGKVILLGGTYRHDNAQTIGPTTITEIGHYRVDQAILTIGTLDDVGAADFSEEEAQIARAMIESAASVTIVADSSKLHKRSTFHVCGLHQIDRLILDTPPDDHFQTALQSAEVELL